LRSARAVLILAAVQRAIGDSTIARLTEVVKVGLDLRRRLEVVARAEGREAASLAKLVLREAVEERVAALSIRTDPR